jgi:hypothetical protein
VKCPVHWASRQGGIDGPGAAILADAGMGIRDLVKITTFLTRVLSHLLSDGLPRCLGQGGQ